MNSNRQGLQKNLSRKKSGLQTGTTASQLVDPNFVLNFSARLSAALQLRTMANVVEPLPDMSAASAPFDRKNSWNNPSNGNLAKAGASSELYKSAPAAERSFPSNRAMSSRARPGRPFSAAGNRA